MKKVLEILLILCLLSGASFAEKLPTKIYPDKSAFNPRYNPVAYRYFEAYAKQLYEAFDTKKLWLPVGYGVVITYYINKDGSVSEVTPEWNASRIPMTYKYGMKIVQEVKAPPFPENLEEERVWVRVFFCNDKFDEIYMNYYALQPPDKRKLSLSIYKDIKIKKHVTPKPRPHFNKPLLE